MSYNNDLSDKVCPLVEWLLDCNGLNQSFSNWSWDLLHTQESVTGEAIGPGRNLLLLFCSMVMLTNWLLNTHVYTHRLVLYPAFSREDSYCGRLWLTHDTTTDQNAKNKQWWSVGGCEGNCCITLSNAQGMSRKKGQKEFKSKRMRKHIARGVFWIPRNHCIHDLTADAVICKDLDKI